MTITVFQVVMPQRSSPLRMEYKSAKTLVYQDYGGMTLKRLVKQTATVHWYKVTLMESKLALSHAKLDHITDLMTANVATVLVQELKIQ